MTTNPYFQLTANNSTKRFRATHVDSLAQAYQHGRRVDMGVTGAVNVTMSATAQKLHRFAVLFNGTESGNYGTYSDLRGYFDTTAAITYTDFDGTTTYGVVFVNTTLEPTWLDPLMLNGFVPISLLQKT